MYQISLKDSTEIKNAIKLIDSLKWHSFNYNIDGNKLSVKSFDDFQLIKDLLKTHNITYIEKRSYINLDPTDLIDFKEFVIKLFRNHPNVYEIQYYYTWPELRDWLSKQNKKVGELIKKFNSLKMKKKSDKDYEKFKNWYDETTQKAFGDKSPYDWSIKSEWQPYKIELFKEAYEEYPEYKKGYWVFNIWFDNGDQTMKFFCAVDPDGDIFEFVPDYQVSDEVVVEMKTKVQQMIEDGEIEKKGNMMWIKKGMKKQSNTELEQGKQIEKEHKDVYNDIKQDVQEDDYLDMTEDEFTEGIAKDHLEEDKNYYTKLKDMEKKSNKKEYSICLYTNDFEKYYEPGCYDNWVTGKDLMESINEAKQEAQKLKDGNYVKLIQNLVSENKVVYDSRNDINKQNKDMEKKSSLFQKGDKVDYNGWAWIVDEVRTHKKYKDIFYYDLYMPGDPSVTEDNVPEDQIELVDKDWDSKDIGDFSDLQSQSSMKQDIENINKQTKEIKNIREEMEDEFKQWHKKDEEIGFNEDYGLYDDNDMGYDDDQGDPEDFHGTFKKVKDMEKKSSITNPDYPVPSYQDSFRYKGVWVELEFDESFMGWEANIYDNHSKLLENLGRSEGQSKKFIIQDAKNWIDDNIKQSHKIIETNDPDLDKYAVKDSNGNIVDSGNNLKELQSKYNKTKIATVEDIVEFEDEAVDGNPDLEQPATPAIDIKQSPRVIIQQLLGLLYSQKPDNLTYTSIVELAEQAGLMDLERYDLISVLNEVAVKVGLVRIGWDEYLPEKDIVQEIQDLPSNFESHPTFEEDDFDVNEVMNGYDNSADKLFMVDRILDERLKMFTNVENVIDESTDVILKAMKPFQKHLSIVSYKLEDVKASRTDRAGKITHGKVIYNVRLRNSQKGNTQGRYLEKTITVELPIRNGSVESPSKFHYSKKDWPLQPYFVNDLFYSDDEINVKRSGLFEDLGDALNPNNSYDSSRYHLPEHNKERDFLIQTILLHSEDYTRESLENYSNEDLTEIKNDVT